MIHLVSSQQELFDNSTYKIIDVKESLELLETIKVVGLDTETSGLDCHTNQLLLVQLGCKDFQVVIDCRTIDIKVYKSYLESDRTFILWNALFDIPWFYEQGIIIKKVYDGFLAEKLLYLGYPSGIHSLSLKAAGENYLGIELDKSVRGKIIWSKTLTDDIIEYGALDVKYLEDICLKQYEELKEKGLTKAIQVENKFVRVLAYIKWCGVKLDIDKWKAKMIKDEARVKQALEVLNKWFLENQPNSPYIKIDTQGDLFLGYNLEPQVTINWNSAKQLIPIFKQYGVDVEVQDKAKGGTKDSIDAKCLKPQKDKCSLIAPYLEYKEAVKVTSTYGQNFLDQVNPNTGRIYTNYGQCGADTTRITSGGKDKAAKVEYVNLLNLPADAETRACFVAEKGNRWISIDYTGQESFLMASIANDEAIIHELTYGDKDLHTLTAKIVYPYIPKDMSAKEVKAKFHKERQESKGYEFCFNYGGTYNTIMQNFGLTSERAQEIENNYMKGFSGLKKYQDFCRKDWFEKGYILLNPITGHKAFIYDYEELLKTKEWMKTLDWDYYREMKKSCPECDTVQRVRRFFKRKSASEKQSINYRIQATGSMCLRFSLIEFFDWICDNNYFNIVKICITPYDEINCEAPEAIAEETATAVYNSMVNAGKIFCTRCKLDADMSRLPDGSLPTYWIH